MKRTKERLHAGELVLAAGLGRIANRNMYQMISLHGGYDVLWFDFEHCGLTVEDLEVGTLAARSRGLETFVRIPPTDYALVTRCMEAGGGGVMAAQISTAEQAEQFVRWSKFYPRGVRGLNSGGFDADFGMVPLAKYCEQANRDSFIAIQIETLGAVEEADGIAAIDGVDVLFVGPADLSQSLGVTGEFFHPKCLAAIDRVAAACKKHGKNWAAVCVNLEHADMLVSKGCKMLSPASDVKIVNAGLHAVKQEFKKYFGQA